MEAKTSSILDLPVALIRPGTNDRKVFASDELAGLADSIRSNGLAQPITVRPLVSGEFQYEVVAGERRLRAIRDQLGWKFAPCIVRPLSDEEASSIMLTENLSRVDLRPSEEALAYQSRVAIGWSLDRIAQAAGTKLDRVVKRMALLALSPIIIQLVDSGQFPLGHADLMTRLDQTRQGMALRIYDQSGKTMTLSSFRSVVVKLQDEQDQEALFALEEFLLDAALEDAVLPSTDPLASIPVLEGLPAIRANATDSAAEVIERYIEDLRLAGFEQEAGAIGTLYSALVRKHFMKKASKAARAAKVPNGVR